MARGLKGRGKNLDDQGQTQIWEALKRFARAMICGRAIAPDEKLRIGGSASADQANMEAVDAKGVVSGACAIAPLIGTKIARAIAALMTISFAA